MYSAFSKTDDRTPHQRWCDAMVKKARAPIYAVKPSTTTIDRYTNYEMIGMLKSVLDK